ncbi:MAG: sigma-70 family RNA polymerase sigma factor [Atribacterota bacterium]|nr:sigma-70 family RNA polymerase sigma factor [Atribacterota bacterium]
MPQLQDDLKIIELCLLGNTQQFSNIIEKYKGMVYNLAYRMCGNYHDSEDITQETFVKTFQALSHFNPAFRFSTWLYQIALNVTKDRLKKKKLDSVSLDNNFADGRELQNELTSFQNNKNNPENYLDSVEKKEMLQQAMLSLPVQYREIIILRHLQDLSYQELATILKVSPDTARVRLFRAREQLKKILKNI